MESFHRVTATIPLTDCFTHLSPFISLYPSVSPLSLSLSQPLSLSLSLSMGLSPLLSLLMAAGERETEREREREGGGGRKAGSNVPLNGHTETTFAQVG